jgi:PAS domain S-box-containing protein
LEERFQLILEGAPDAIVVTRQDGRIVLVNTQTERLFGYARKSCWDKKWKCCCPSAPGAGIRKIAPPTSGNPGVRPMGTGLELYGRRKDGSEFPVDVSLSHLETGGETLVSGFIRDITERKQSEERSSHLASMIQASDDALSANPWMEM